MPGRARAQTPTQGGAARPGTADERAAQPGSSSAALKDAEQQGKKRKAREPSTLQQQQQQQQQQQATPVTAPRRKRQRQEPSLSPEPPVSQQQQQPLASSSPSPSQQEDGHSDPGAHSASPSPAPEDPPASAKRSPASPSPSPSPEPEQQQGDDQAHRSSATPSLSPEPGAGRAPSGSKPSKPVLSKERMLKLKDKAERKGVVYISRIPPHMKPSKVRQMLSVHGEIGRLYLAPEDKAARRDRKKRNGGRDTGKSFTEGWVEFEDKRVAKRVAEMLNGQPIGGKKRSAYFYDLWCLKYLSKFKWDHLTEEISYQRAVREQRLAAEISAAKRERDMYLSRVDRAKAVQAIQQRKKAKGGQDAQEEGGGQGAGDGKATGASGASGARLGGAGAGGGDGQGRGQHIHQRRAKAEGLEEGAGTLPDDVLGLIAARRS